MEKRRISRNYAIQKRFGYYLFIIATITVLLNLYNKLYLGNMPLFDVLIYIGPILFVGACGYFSALKESRVIQFIQVALVYLVATGSILTYRIVENISGEVVALLGMYMAVQLGFFKRYFYIKSFLSILYIGVLKFSVINQVDFAARQLIAVREKLVEANFSPEEMTLLGVDKPASILVTYVNYLLLVGSIIVLFWLIIKDQIQEYIERGKGLQDRFNKNSVFIDIGKIVWGFLHDLGDINYSLVDVRMLKANLKKSMEAKDPDKSILEKSYNSADRIEKMLMAVDYKQEGIKKIIKAKHLIENENMEVNELIRNLISFLKITYNLKDIAFEVDLSDEKMYIKASPFEILQSVENIIRNSIEAMRDNKGSKLSITTVKGEGKAHIEIFDSGGGISFIEKDGLVDLDEFQIGRTTKNSKGTGWGMYTSIQNIQHNSGMINIYTTKGLGTKFEILFDLIGGINE